jgi:YgiT-type zinc finger domain-containing protein
MKRFSGPLSMIPCSDCSVGQMRRTTVTYFTFAGSHMITVPDFPAWVCDMCGKCEYDLEALDNLALLLSPQDKQLSAKQRTHPAVRDNAHLSAAQSNPRK